MLLKDKIAIITGGSIGIGKAIAIAYANEGAHLVLTSRTKAELASTKREIAKIADTKVEIFPADVSNPKAVNDLTNFTIEKFHTIDILVNCAGIYGPIGLITDIDNSKWLETIKINLFGTFLCMQAVLHVMMQDNKGKILLR